MSGTSSDQELRRWVGVVAVLGATVSVRHDVVLSRLCGAIATAGCGDATGGGSVVTVAKTSGKYAEDVEN